MSAMIPRCPCGLIVAVPSRAKGARCTCGKYVWKYSRAFTWQAVCPEHGAVEIVQQTKPTLCKCEVKLSKRCRRQCRRDLRDVKRKDDTQAGDLFA